MLRKGMRHPQVCDHCGGRFGLLTHRWWSNKFCKKKCKDAHLRELAFRRDQIRRWYGFLSQGGSRLPSWPRQRLTKGDLFRYHRQVAPFILPVVADRPLAMKRFPNGIAGKPFYQHHLDETATVPKGVRVELVGGPGSRHREERKPQFVGGALATLLYMTQLASISQDPWFSRVQSIDEVDCAALDLDPPAGVPFARVLEVARWIHDELDALGVAGFPKTSGADGLHIYLPMPPGTPSLGRPALLPHHRNRGDAETSQSRDNRTERSGEGDANSTSIYLRTASARESRRRIARGPASTRRVDAAHVARDPRRRESGGVSTIQTVPARLKKIGDLWAGLRTSKGVDLARVSRTPGAHRCHHHFATTKRSAVDCGSLHPRLRLFSITLKPRVRIWRSGLKQWLDSHKRRLTPIYGWPELADAESRRASPPEMAPGVRWPHRGAPRLPHAKDRSRAHG